MTPAASRLKAGREAPWVTGWSQEAQTGVWRCPGVDGALAVGFLQLVGVEDAP
jgi:hypothetical protein